MFRSRVTNNHRIGFIVLLLFACTLAFSGCKTVWRTVWYNVPGINDHEKFPYRTVNRGDWVQPLTEGYEEPLPPLESWAFGKRYKEGDTPDEFFKRTGTIAFLVLHGDTIMHEYYAKNFDRESTFTTFSLAKVYVSTLVGIAIEEGYIKSLDQQVSDFLPEFEDSALSDITIKHLVQMTSGLKSHEKFSNPFNKVVKMYYGSDLRKASRNLKVKHTPGTRFRYLNINTLILSFVLKEATGMPVSKYLEEKIWKPAGMESNATWSLDHEGGEEKAFCCINGHARDFARFGLLFLRQGRCGGDTLISGDWICEATSLDTTQGSHMRYQYNWYTSAEEEDYFGQGLIGQYLYICPKTNTVIVRLGRKIEFSPWYSMFKILAGVSYLPKKIDIPKEELRRFEGDYTFGLSNRGDSALVGKVATINAKNGFLKVKADFRSSFKVQPESDSLFFHLRDARKLKFHIDDDGDVTGIHWERRGNSWELVRNSISTDFQAVK